MDYRAHGNARDVHGSVGYERRERGASAHRRQPFGRHDESTWILTSYLVSNAIILPMSGWFSPMIGRKRFYMSCVALFTDQFVSVRTCPVASASLIFFRVLQGVGGGGLQPSEQAILADTFSPQAARHGVRGLRHGRGAGTSHWADARRLDHRQFRWRWIFFINIPVGIISLFLTNMLITDPPYMKEKEARDSASITSAWDCWLSDSARCKWCWIRVSVTIGSARTSSSR